MKLISTFFSGKSAVAKLLLITIFAIAGQATIFAQNSINISTEKANTLFVGVTNPINIKVDGISDDQVYLASDEVEIEKMGKGLFNVRVANPGKVTLTVHGDGAFQYKNYQFDVQELQSPLAVVLFLEDGSVKIDGEISAELFKKAEGLGFRKTDNAMTITNFNMIRVPKIGDPVEVSIYDADLNQMAKRLVQSAVSGDKFYFDNVMGTAVGAASAAGLTTPCACASFAAAMSVAGAPTIISMATTSAGRRVIIDIFPPVQKPIKLIELIS